MKTIFSKILFRISIKFLILAIIPLVLAYLVFAGYLQKVIYFADPLNEMAFFLVCVCTSIFLFGSVFEKRGKNSEKK